MKLNWNFKNTYCSLPAAFFSRLKPEPVRAPEIAIFNYRLAASLGLIAPGAEEPVDEHDLQALAGNLIPDGADPIAQAYAGHQFGNFTMLGDGRAIVLGEHLTPGRERFDIQLKGSGQTPFSRRGDGRAALGPMLREYVISEAMAALGIPTTRSLAVVQTGESIMRERALPGAILTRVAASHIRVGTFEFAAAAGGPEAVKALADYIINRHFQELSARKNPIAAFLQTVIDRQARLISQWMLTGFIHGVMNTDNMAISGDTIDYGPCAFMNVWNPNTVFSSIDQDGRYAYGNQPLMAQWNLARFTETLLPLLHADETVALKLAHDAIDSFPGLYQNYWLQGMRGKLGLSQPHEGDLKLIEDLLALMKEHHLDFTNTFRILSLAAVHTYPPGDLAKLSEFPAWYLAWQVRLEHELALNKHWQPEDAQKLMLKCNPAYIPRNHLVELALDRVVVHKDYAPLMKLLSVLSSPFTEKPECSAFQEPPDDSGSNYRTFCGT